MSGRSRVTIDGIPVTSVERVFLDMATMLELIRAAGLPEPSVNVIVTGEVVDFHWPQFNLVVEIDSWEYHRLRGPFQEDKRRGNRLELANVMVLRYLRPRRRAGAAALGR